MPCRATSMSACARRHHRTRVKGSPSVARRHGTTPITCSMKEHPEIYISFNVVFAWCRHCFNPFYHSFNISVYIYIYIYIYTFRVLGWRFGRSRCRKHVLSQTCLDASMSGRAHTFFHEHVLSRTCLVARPACVQVPDATTPLRRGLSVGCA